MPKSEESGSQWIRTPVNGVDSARLSAVLGRYDLRKDSRVWSWITSFDRLVASDEQQWFLSHLDFTNPDLDSAFRWDEFEQMSSEAAAEDQKWRAAIDRFWRQHLPLYLDVRSGYRSLLARIDQGECCGIYESIEPEFEEVTLFASSIDEMQRLLFVCE